MVVKDKIVCIDDSNRPNEIPVSSWIKKDQIYTIDKVGKDFQGVYFFFLREIKNPAPYLGFRVDRFRPVDEVGPELSDSISVSEDGELIVKEKEFSPLELC